MASMMTNWRRMTIFMVVVMNFMATVMMASASTPSIQQNIRNVDIAFLYDDNHPKVSIDDFITEQGKMIDHTKAIDDHSTLPDKAILMDKYVVMNPSGTGIPNPYAGNSQELQAFLQNVEEIAKYDSAKATAPETGTILMTADQVEKVISSATSGAPAKPLVIGMVGRGSKGKSSNWIILLGHDVVFTAPGESTKRIIEYYVHSISAGQTPSFYKDAIDKSDPSKEVTEKEMKDYVTSENQALPNIDATLPPLKCAIYTNKALFYGKGIDTPGIRSTTPGSPATNNDQAIYDMIEKILDESSDESTIFVTESIGLINGATGTSLEPIAEEMEKRSKLEPFLKRSIVLIGQANLCETMQPTQKGAFDTNNEEILKAINDFSVKTSLSPQKPIFVGMKMLTNPQGESYPDTWTDTEDTRISGIVASQLVGTTYESKVSAGGWNEVLKDLLDSQTRQAGTRLSQTKRDLKDFLRNNKKSHHNRALPKIFTGLQEGEKRLMRFIETYMSGHDPDTARKVQYFVSINRDDEPKLHEYLAPLFKSPGGLLHRSKYAIDGNDITETNLESLIDGALDKLDQGNTFRKAPLNRNGYDEVQLASIRVSAFLLSIELKAFDETRFSQTFNNYHDVAQGGSNFKTSVDGIMQDDVRVIFHAISLYLDDVLDWLFPKIIDAALLLDKVFPPNSQVSVLDYAEPMLELRYRAKQAANLWSSEIMILLNNNIDKGNTVRPEEIKSLGVSFTSLLQTFYTKLTSSSSTTASKQERSKNIMEAYFGAPSPIDHQLVDVSKRLEYAKDLFEIQVTYILQELNTIFKRELIPFDSKQTTQQFCFRKIFKSYLYHDVAKPLLHYITETEISDQVDVDEASKFPFVMHAPDQEKRLIEAFQWTKPTGGNMSPTQTLVEALTELGKKSSEVLAMLQ